LSTINSKKVEEYYMKVGTILKYAAGAACVLTLACGSLYAQDLRVAHTTAAPKSANVPSQPLPPAVVKLFNNLGPTPTDNYNDTTGYYVLGPTNSLADSEQWIGVPFTVTKAGDTITATKVLTGITCLAATDCGRITVAIYNDGGGFPGTSLGGGTTNVTAIFGTCCTTTATTITPNVVLTSGTQYWVVATTIDTGAGANPTFTGVWSASNLGNLDGNNVGGNEAAGTWFGFSANVPAVEVMGTEVAAN
jgi:hypothetical protein